MLILCNPAGKYIARLCIARITRRHMSTRSSQQVHCPPTRCPHYSPANVYAIQPASTLPAYALPALLAGTCLRDPAGKCIARLRVAHITRRQMSTRSSRQVHCPPTHCPHYAPAKFYAIQQAIALPAYALNVIPLLSRRPAPTCPSL